VELGAVKTPYSRRLSFPTTSVKQPQIAGRYVFLIATQAEMDLRSYSPHPQAFPTSTQVLLDSVGCKKTPLSPRTELAGPRSVVGA